MFYGILIVVLAILLAVGGFALVERLVPWQVRRRHNDVAGFIYAVVGIAYAVLLAFLVIAVWERYEAARETADREGNELAEIYWLANQFPDSERRQVQETAQSYAQVVVDEEWPMLEDGKSSPQAWALMDQIRQSVQQFKPTTSGEQVLYAQGLSRVHDLSEARRLRLLDASAYIPAILWIILIAGGVVTVGFTYLFGMKNSRAHVLMVVSLTVIITSVLFTTCALEHVFSAEALG
jgi:hypothetical protein